MPINDPLTGAFYALVSLANGITSIGDALDVGRGEVSTTIQVNESKLESSTNNSWTYLNCSRYVDYSIVGRKEDSCLFLVR